MQLVKRRRIANRIAPLIFACSLLFLAGLATLVVIWVDVPSLQERAIELEQVIADEILPAGEADSMPATQPPAKPYPFLLAALGLLWLIFFAEAIFQWSTRPWTRRYLPYHLRSLVFVSLPPLRLCSRQPDLNDAIWFPNWGWQIPNARLRLRLTRFFGVPMLGIALMILPVLAIEFFLQDQVAKYGTLRLGLHISTGLIWFAFATEFIIMISAAESRLQYCKKHWIDLAIILLPLLSFLRSLQIVRVTRLGKLAKMQQLTKMARVYRLRGLSTKVLRAFVLFEIVDRLLRPDPEKRLAHLRKEHRKLSHEMRELEDRIRVLEANRVTLDANAVE